MSCIKVEHLNIDEVTDFFTYLSSLKITIISNNLRYFQFLNSLNSFLISSLDHLSERNVIDIIVSFRNLGTSIPNTLLVSLKEMFIETIKENPENLASPFLINSLTNFSKLNQKNRLSNKEVFLIIFICSNNLLKQSLI